MHPEQSRTSIHGMAPFNNSKIRAQVSQPIGVELFAGAGGMSLGFEQAGFNIAAAIELDPINVCTHKQNFQHCKTIQADISQLSGKDLLDKANLKAGSVDLIFGGPPCQGFSLIGKRHIQDERNQLLFHFARLVREIQPTYFVLENVPGLLLGDAIEAFHSFRRRIRKAGFNIVEPVRILNATEFGIPQNRQRVFLLGFKKDKAPPHYPIRPLSCDNRMPTVWDAIGDLSHLDNCPETLMSDRYYGKLGPPSEYVKSLGECDINRFYPTTVCERGIGGCFRTNHSGKIQRRFASTASGSAEKVSRYFKLDGNGVAPTLRAGTGPDHGSHTAARPIHPKAPRCITTREAARLHSFPDWFEFHPTKWHGFRQVGNSVPPLLAKAVAHSIIVALTKQTQP